MPLFGNDFPPQNENNSPLVEVDRKKLFEFASGKKYGKMFEETITRAMDFEQGLTIYSKFDRKGFAVLSQKDIDLTSIGSDSIDDLLRMQLAPVLIMHCHPISNIIDLTGERFYRKGLNYVPSTQDLQLPNTEDDFGTFLKPICGMVVTGHPPVAWVWIEPTENRVLNQVISERKQWSRELREEVTYDDIENLKLRLKNAGLKLVTGNLDPKNKSQSFVSLAEHLNFTPAFRIPSIY